MKTQTLAKALAWVAVAAWALGAVPLAQAQGRSGGGAKTKATQPRASSQQGQQAGQRGVGDNPDPGSVRAEAREMKRL